jgi:4-methyl-5(b-hydroxyethyl)-thiazole monophosphate biosynthesis
MHTNVSVLMFLSQGFEDLEAATIIDVLGWTRVREHLSPIALRTCAFHDEVVGTFGLRITVDYNLRTQPPDLTQFAAFVVPGGFHSAGFDEAYDEEIHRLAAAVSGQSGIIATMCVGALPIADAGLLQHKRATTYPLSRFHDNVARLRAGQAVYTGAKLETDANIITCAGPASALEVAYRLVDMLTGAANAAEVKRLMMA